MTQTDMDALREAGVDLDGTMARFMKNETLFLKFLRRFPADESMAGLKAAVEAGKIPEAFRAAHTLKGIAGNLGLNTLMQIDVPLVEELRVGNGENMKRRFEELEAEYKRLCAVIESLS